MSSTNIDPGITETAQTIGNRAVNGSVSVSRNANVGGDATVEGSAVIGHNLRVEGWLEAKNIKGPNKGMFVSADRLREMYPRPLPGWWALCGLSLPAPLYIADYTTSGIEWVNTGTTAGNPTVACEVYNEAVKLLDEATKRNAAEISKNRKAIEDMHAEIVAICRIVTRMEDEHKEMKELVEGFDSRVTNAQKTADAAMPPTITLGELDTLGTDGELMSMYGLLRDKPHTRYRVVTTYGKETFTVGVLDVYMDSMRHVITEVLTTHYILDEASGLLSSAHKDDSLYFYYRAYNIDSSSLTASGVAKKTWSSWCEYSDELREMLSDSVELLNEVRDDLFQEISDRKAGDEACRGYTDDCSQSLDRKIDTVQALLEKDMEDLHDEMTQSDEAVEQRLGKRIDGALELIADCADAEITDGKFKAVNERLDNLSQEHEGDVNSLDRKIDTVQAVLEKDIADGDEAVRSELTARINSLSGASSASSRDISRLEVWPFAKVVAEGDDITKNPEAVRIKYGLAAGDIVYSEQYRGFAAFTGNGFSADWGNEVSVASDAVGDQVLPGGGSAGSGGSVTETVKFTEAEFYGDVFPGVGERTCRRPARKSLYRLTDDNSLWVWTGSALRKVADVEALEALRLRLETLIGNGNVSEVIDTFNEIEAFLQGITNAETLTGLLQNLKAEALNEVTANYLKLTGGKISSTSSTPVVLDSTHATQNVIPYQLGSVNKAWSGYLVGSGAGIFNYAANRFLGIKDDGTPHFNGNKIWHEGNDGTGSGLDADLLRGRAYHTGYNIFYNDILEVQGTAGSEWSVKILMGNNWTSDFYRILLYAPYNNIYGMLKIEKEGISARCTYEATYYGGINILGIHIAQGTNGRLEVTLKMRACNDDTGVLKIYRPDSWTTAEKLDTIPNVEFSPVVHKYFSGTVKAPNFEGTATNIQTKQLTNEDLNDIKTQTFANYWGNASNTCKNKPAGVTIFNLTSRMVSSRFAHFLVDQNGTNWQRSFDGTSWTDWQQIATMSDLEPIKVKTNKLIVGATIARDWSKIPVTHKIVTGSLNGSDVTINLAGTGAIPIGESIHCIIKNIHSAVAAVLSLTAFPRRNCETYIIQPGCYAEVNILYDGSEYYLRVI